MMDLPGLESISIKGMEVQADDLFILERQVTAVADFQVC